MKTNLHYSSYILFFSTTYTNSFQPLLPKRRITQLHYYKPNLPLSSRLTEIKSELTNIQKGGLDKFLLDEISTAQKRLSIDVKAAEKYADDIVKKGRGEEGKLMRDTLKNGDEMNVLLNGLKGVKQELEEVRGVKSLGGVVEETLKNDLLLENDLQSVTDKVASSLKDAEVSIQSSLTTLSSGEISDNERDRVLKQLETTLKSIQQSFQTSNTLATSAKKSTDENFAILKKIAETRHDLMDAMEDTEETIGFIAERQESEGKSLLEVVNGMGDVAYETIKQVESVEKLANVLTTKVGTSADAILSLNTKSSEIVLGTLQRTIDNIRETKSSPEGTKMLTECINKVKQQGDTVRQFANAIKSDITHDNSALDTIKSANIKLQALLDSAETQVEITKRAVVTGGEVDPSYIEQNIVNVKSAILAIMDATKASADYAIEKIQSSKDKVTEKIGVDETVKSAVDKIPDTPASKEEPKAVKPESKAEPKTEDTKKETGAEKTEQKESTTSNSNENKKTIDQEQKVESKTTEAEEHKESIKSEQKVESKTTQAKEHEEPVKSEQKVESKTTEATEHESTLKSDEKPEIKPEKKLESKPTDANKDTDASKPDGGIKSDKTETKNELIPSSKDSSATDNQVKSTDEVPQKVQEDAKSLDQSKHVADTQSLDSKPQTKDASENADTKVTTVKNEPSNSWDSTQSSKGSDIPSTSEMLESKTTILAQTEQPIVEPPADVATTAHGATESINSLSASVDVGDLHPSSEVGGEVANAVSNAVDVVHDLANVIATSLFV